MNVKVQPETSSSSSEEDISEDNKRIENKGFSNWTRNVNLFILVFFAGVLSASVVAIGISEYFGLQKGHSSTHSDEPGPSGTLLPDPDHLRVVDETKFTTQLQRFTLASDIETSDERASEAEALKNLQAALMFKKKGNAEKAYKLFKHALALSPKNPSILNHFGEFLVDAGDDPIEADHMFVKAIAFSKEGSEPNLRALLNRQKTARVVDELDGKKLTVIDSKKKEFLRINRKNSAAMRRAKKEAYYQHIHHTVGIEGNTLTLAQTRVLLETRLAIGGKSVQEHNEVLGLDLALKYINQTLVDRPMGHITTRDLLEIHKRVIGHVDPLEAGIFRQTQVYVGDFIPPHPSHVDLLMARFLQWLNDPKTLMMHPVRLAALAHYKLVYIHPFTDGNGRTSRLLMNWILMQNGFPPVIIRKQDRLLYYQYLVTANDGDIRPFVRFIAKCTERTLDAYLWSTKENSLAPFGDESETIISPVNEAMDHLDYHDAVISGGSIGPNMTIQP